MTLGPPRCVVDALWGGIVATRDEHMAADDSDSHECRRRIRRGTADARSASSGERADEPSESRGISGPLRFRDDERHSVRARRATHPSPPDLAGDPDPVDFFSLHYL